MPSLTLRDALISASSPFSLALFLVYAVGLILVLRNRSRLGSSAGAASLGYTLLCMSSVSSYAFTVWRLLSRGGRGPTPNEVDTTSFFFWNLLTWALTMSGAILLLVALLRARTDPGAR